MRPVPTYPNSLHVERNTVCRDPLMIQRREDVVFPRFVVETPAELFRVALELVSGKDLVGERGKGQVKVVGQLFVLELWGLRQRFPDLLHVCRQGCLKVRERCGSDVVADDEEQ